MKRIAVIFLIALLICTNDAYSFVNNQRPFHELKGYKRLVFKLVSMHPKLNSALEKDLLKHYLLGSGTTYQLSDSDFVRLKKVSKFHFVDSVCRIIHSSNEQYCYRLVDLNNDDYFGWGLGTISVIFQQASGELISIADSYDFNKKKKGIRRFKNELISGIFRLIAPSSAKSFIVTYRADGYFLTN
jgi:hypothetical protein